MHSRHLLLPFVVAFSAACQGNTEPMETTDTTDTPGAVDTGYDTDDYKTLDTGEPKVLQDLTGQFGSVVMGHRGPVPPGWFASASGDADHYALAAFTDQMGGVLDIPYCGFIGLPCVTEYPAEGKSASLVSVLDLYTDEWTWHNAGATISAGGVNLGRIPADFTYYDTAFVETLPRSGELSFDGDLAPYSATDVMPRLDGRLAVSAPATGAPLQVEKTDTLSFAWTPGGAGSMYLQTPTEMLGLPDTGTFELPVDALGMEAPIDVGSVTLARITHATVDAAGNEVYLQTRSDQPYAIHYRDAEGWTDFVEGSTIADSCADARSLPPLAPGNYIGDLGRFGNDHDPGFSSSVVFWPALGSEGVVRIDLEAGQELIVKYKQPMFDAALYLMTDDCDAVAATEGINARDYGEVEDFTYESEAGGTYYMALDSTHFYPPLLEGGPFWLEVEID